MLIGAMNHPGRDPVAEIERIAAMGLDFVDLTLEPPAASSWRIDPRAVREALTRRGLGVVGHTAYYLPIASPFEPIRRAAVEELRDCLEHFAAIGATLMNLHPDRKPPLQDRAVGVEQNLRSLGELLPDARRLGVQLMIENLPETYNDVDQLAPLLEPLPELGFHLDIGHANLHTARSTVPSLLAAFGPRLRHVHLHDNRGGSQDLHLPLGCGTVDVPAALAALRSVGYDGTITLEVFTEDPEYLLHSARVLRGLWDGT